MLLFNFSLFSDIFSASTAFTVNFKKTNSDKNNKIDITIKIAKQKNFF